MADLSDNLPDWLLRLRAVPEAESAIHWLSDEEISTARAEFDEEDDDHLKLYGSIYAPCEEDLRGQAVDRMTRCVKVGEGVTGGRFSVQSRIMHSAFDYQAEFWFDPNSPDGLLCSLNDDCPPHLWFPVGQTLESISSTVAVYYPGIAADPAEGPAVYAARLRSQHSGREVPAGWTTARMLLGVVEEMRVIENALIFRPAFCRSFDALGTALGADSTIPITAFNTVNSFSRIVMEFHTWLQYDLGNGDTGSPVVAEISYPPAGQGEVIRRYNEALDLGLPEDVPVDVVGALFGYPVKSLARLHWAINLEGEPHDITYVMGLLAAVEYDNAALLAVLQKFATHESPQVRAKTARYGLIRRQLDLVRQMLNNEQDPELREYIQGLLESEEQE